MNKPPNNNPNRQSYINPLNPYTGQVSILALLKNITNGHGTFRVNSSCTKKLTAKSRNPNREIERQQIIKQIHLLLDRLTELPPEKPE